MNCYSPSNTCAISLWSQSKCRTLQAQPASPSPLERMKALIMVLGLRLCTDTDYLHLNVLRLPSGWALQTATFQVLGRVRAGEGRRVKTHYLLSTLFNDHGQLWDHQINTLQTGLFELYNLFFHYGFKGHVRREEPRPAPCRKYEQQGEISKEKQENKKKWQRGEGEKRFNRLVICKGKSISTSSGRSFLHFQTVSKKPLPSMDL